MQVKNKSARVWTVSGVLCVPGQTTDVPNGNPADVKGNDDLEVVDFKDVEFTEEKVMTANELKAALDEKGIEYKTNASKADLQALLDSAE